MCSCVRSSRPWPPAVTAPVYRGCLAGTHWGDDSSRQDDEPSERQLCAVLVLRRERTHICSSSLRRCHVREHLIDGCKIPWVVKMFHTLGRNSEYSEERQHGEIVRNSMEYWEESQCGTFICLVLWILSTHRRDLSMSCLALKSTSGSSCVYDKTMCAI